MPIAQLISPQALDLKKDQPGLVILDCRFALEDPDYGQRSYAEGHIAGSSYADLERDLSGAVVKGVTGRHPLPEPAQLIERLQAWGINADSEVVLYDDGPGAYAAGLVVAGLVGQARRCIYPRWRPQGLARGRFAAKPGCAGDHSWFLHRQS